jgi:hypothetical protein
MAIGGYSQESVAGSGTRCLLLGCGIRPAGSTGRDTSRRRRRRPPTGSIGRVQKQARDDHVLEKERTHQGGKDPEQVQAAARRFGKRAVVRVTHSERAAFRSPERNGRPQRVGEDALERTCEKVKGPGL